MSFRAYGILLAAGAGRRFGGRKMVSDWNGELLVNASVRNALATPIDGLVVVAGADRDEIRQALSIIEDPRLRLVFNSDWASGIASSLAAGIRALPDDADCALVFLGDMPGVPPSLGSRLVEAIAEGAPAALVEVDGAPGHPVAASSVLFERMCALDGDRGARRLLAAEAGCVTLATDDPGAVFDVDLPRSQTLEGRA